MQRASLQNCYCLDDTQWSKAATMSLAFKGKVSRGKRNGSLSPGPTPESSDRILFLSASTS